MKRLCCLLVLAGVAGLVSISHADMTEQNRDLRRTPVVEAVEKVRASVVNISTERMVTVRWGFDPFFGDSDDVFDQMFRDFFGPRYAPGPVERKKVELPLGSGCVITADGLVVTNEHVVRRATNLKLSLYTGETFEAELLAADPTEDLALLRAKAPHPLQSIPMGSSATMMLGETVLALGNPYGFENSVTSGIVSAFNREIALGGRNNVKYTGLIQTSALINPGNSGGPLVNVLGELVGINTAVVDQAQGIGFSIPIDRAREVLAPLLATPQVSEAWMGFKGETTETRDGVRITHIEEKSPAAKQLKEGDIIRRMDDVAVGDLFDLHLRIVQRKPGDEIALALDRGEEAVTVNIELGRMPAPTPKKILLAKFGLQGQDLTKALVEQLGTAVDYGVLITEVDRDSVAEVAGLRRGDVIVQIGSNIIRDLKGAAVLLRNVRAGEQVYIRIVRGRYVAGGYIQVAE